MKRPFRSGKHTKTNANSTKKFFDELANCNEDLQSLLPFLYKNFVSHSGNYINSFDEIFCNTKHGDCNTINDTHWIDFDAKWVKESISESYWNSIIKSIVTIQDFQDYSIEALDESESHNNNEGLSEDELTWIRLFARFEEIIEAFKKSIHYLSSIPHYLNLRKFWGLGWRYGWSTGDLLEKQIGLKNVKLSHKLTSKIYKEHAEFVLLYDQPIHFHLLATNSETGIHEIKEIHLSRITEKEFDSILYLMNDFRSAWPEYPPVLIFNRSVFINTPPMKILKCSWYNKEVKNFDSIKRNAISNNESSKELEKLSRPNKLLVELLQRQYKNTDKKASFDEGRLKREYNCDNKESTISKLIAGDFKDRRKPYLWEILKYLPNSKELTFHPNLNLLILTQSL